MIKRQKLEHPLSVTDQEQLLEAGGGVNVAPPWFVGAFAEAFAAALAPIMTSLDALTLSSIRAHNSSATLAEHAITMLPIAVAGGPMTAPAPVVSGVVIQLPTTIQDLQVMADREVRAFMVLYGLPVIAPNNTNVKRKNALARFIGIRVVVV